MTGNDPLSWPLDQIAIEITTRCNLTCEMCSIWKLPEHDALSYETFCEVLSAARRLGATDFIPSGAEPFMREDFIDILEFAHSVGYKLQDVVTNGVLLAGYIDRLRQIPSVYLHVSLDGPESVHDRLRGEGTYRKALNAIQLAREYGISVGLSGILMPSTIGTAKHLIDLTAKMGLGDVSYQPFLSEVAWETKDASEWIFSPSQRNFVQIALDDLADHAHAQGVRIYTEPLFRYIVPFCFDGHRPIPSNGCRLPSHFIVITRHGDIFPCFFMQRRVIGNILQGDRLEYIWHNDAHMEIQKLALSRCCPGCLASCSDIASYSTEADFCLTT